MTAVSPKAIAIRSCGLVVIDEATMSHKNVSDYIDRVLALVRNNHPDTTRRLLIVFSGDFQQILPIVPFAASGEEVSKSLIVMKAQIHCIVLKEIFRANKDAIEFKEFLNGVGRETLYNEQLSSTRTRVNFLLDMIVLTNKKELINRIFPTEKLKHPETLNYASCVL